MTRLTCLALAAWLPALAAWGQIAEQPGVDLQAGLIIANVSADAKGHLNGVPDQAFSDLTLSFTFEQTTTSDEASSLFSISTATDDSPKVGVRVLGKTELQVDYGPPSTLAGMSIPKGLLLGKHHLVLVVKRDPRQALSSVWFDGVECYSFTIPPGQWQIPRQLLVGTRTLTEPAAPPTISNIRLYNRALSRPEIIALAQQDAPKKPQDIIALIGGSEAVALAESGWLEAFLSIQRAGAATGSQPLVRDLAWEGDTVFEQKRPLNFGSLAQQLDRIQAQQVMLMFGRQECLERGAEGVPAFRDALTKLVQHCPRGVVLIGPVPFEKKDAPLPDLAAKNAVLDLYTQAMSAVATENGGRCVFTSADWPKSTASWTRDGLTLNDHGTRTLADIIVNVLAGSWRPPALDYAKLRTLAQAKEQLWHKYWRPSNWAFLYGDRTTQPSSRDHLNPNVRWFPQELEQYRDLIDAKENELWKLSQELGRKLP